MGFPKNKTYEEIFGVERARQLKEEKSKKFSGKNNPNYGGKIIKKYGHPMLGFKHKKETIANFSEQRKDKTWEERFGEEKAKEMKINMSLRQVGRITSEETKLKQSQSKLGKKYSEEARRNMSLGRLGEKNHRYGKHLTDEIRMKIGLGNKGKVVLIETRKKLSIANKGKHNSPETELKKGCYGEKSIAWLDGKSFEPYTKEFNKLFKEGIRQRDKFTCMKCNLIEIDAKKLYGQNLHVHHIDYIKENTFKENCCALCFRCNIEVNGNRPHWTKFFQSLLKERYGYQYSEDQKIILDFRGE